MSGTGRTIAKWLVIAAAGAVALADTAAAQQSSEKGLVLARQWCTACHLVEAGTKGPDTAPPFPVMANDPAYTQRRIRGWLLDPHPPMKGINLTNEQIDSILAYLNSLRKK